MNKENWIWMPHAGHLCVSNDCRFRLNTYVGKYIVSTVGEYFIGDKVREIGCNRLYETMVFKAVKTKHVCCPYEALIADCVDFDGYDSDEDAYKGHLKLCKKWSKKRK